MKLDTKEIVLYGLCMEYQKDIPDMTLVTAEVLGLNDDAFNVAMMKLGNEGLITVKDVRTLSCLFPEPLMDTVLLTPEGCRYVEEKLKMPPRLTAQEKGRFLLKRFSAESWRVLIEIAGRVVTELVSGTVR